MGIKFANSAFATLASSITNSDTSITLTTGQGARFPSLSGGDYFYATLIDTSNNLEIVKCTARSTDVLTVTRGQESTTARSFSAGDRIELRITAQGMVDNLLATDIDAILPSQTSNSGKFLTTNGTAASWGTVPAAYGLQSQQVFTANGTWTKPSGITKVKVIVTGGGGGGGGGQPSYNHGGGGGAGATAIKIIDVSAVSTVSVTVGSGGGGGGGGSAGSAGGTSSFGAYCSATGGGGGPAAQTNSAGGTGGTASGGDINVRGGTGQTPGGGNGTDETVPGGGGASFWGDGGGAAPQGGTSGNSVTGYDAIVYGAGGGPGDHDTSNGSGGAGKSGIVVVEEYA